MLISINVCDKGVQLICLYLQQKQNLLHNCNIAKKKLIKNKRKRFILIINKFANDMLSTIVNKGNDYVKCKLKSM